MMFYTTMTFYTTLAPLTPPTLLRPLLEALRTLGLLTSSQPYFETLEIFFWYVHKHATDLYTQQNDSERRWNAIRIV